MLRVLFVEDAETDMRLMTRLLDKSGYKVEYQRVENKETLTAALTDQKWEIIVVDYQLPQLDAPRTLSIAKQIAPQTPCIVVTGTMGEEVAVEMMRRGAADVIVKTNLARFVPAVERELRESENRRIKERLVRLQQEEHRILELVARGTALPEVFTALARLAEQEIPGTHCAIMLTDSRGRIQQVHAPHLQPCCRPDLTSLSLGTDSFLLPQETADTSVVMQPPSEWLSCSHYKCLWTRIIRSESASDEEMVAEASKDSSRHERNFGVLALFASEWKTPTYLDEQALSMIVQISRIALERERAERARREAEARLRLAISHLPAIVWVADEQGIITFCEGSGAQTLGIDAPSAIGRSIFSIFPDDPQGQENLHLALAGERRNWELSWQGSFFDTNAALVSTEQGVLLVGVAVDVTERRRLQAQLLQSAKMAAMGELIAGVVHELNNPLTVISARAELMSLTGTPDVCEDADTIFRMAQRMNRLIRSLLDFSRQSAPVEVITDWNQMVTAAIDIARLALKKSGVALELDLQPDIPPVLVKPDQIEQVLMNLIHNSEYAMRTVDPMRRKITVRTRFVQNELCSYAEVSVEDNGIGIPESEQSHIFEPFFTTKPPGDGTGLGLSVCHGIVSQHAGTIKFISELGQGTTFRIRIPVAPTESWPSNEAISEE